MGSHLEMMMDSMDQLSVVMMVDARVDKKGGIVVFETAVMLAAWLAAATAMQSD